MVTIDTWRERMSEDMRLRDFRPRTQEGYMAATRQFIEWLGRGPESATDKDVRNYFLYLREDKQLAPSSIHVMYALRFFFAHTMQRPLEAFAILRVNKPRLLPVVLSPGEVRSVVGVVREPVRRMALATIYALGLRLNEGLSLETGHIDSERLTVWVRNGKGAEDRGVPLPRPLLARAPMILGLADVLRRHAPAYLERYQEAMLPSHAQAIRDILRCRTPLLGGHQAECGQCGREHLLYHSCGNRACPRCGDGATTKWLTRQRELLLPVRYFHVVFTLPSELRRIVRSHQQPLLSVLFQAAFETLAELCADPHYLGAQQIGALAVLHTWTRTLEWHPHVHMLVPGGGLAADGRTWLSVPRRRKRFFIPVRALAKRFRGRFLHLARRALPDVSLPEIPWDKRWVAFAKPAVQGPDKVLDYLGRYVFRTALSDKAIVGCDEHSVTFTYRPSDGSPRWTMTLPANECLRRFLQHVLPKGFHRVRAFGLLHPAHRATLRRLQLQLVPPSPAPPRLRCPHCGQPALRLVRRLSPQQCADLLDRAELDPSHAARAPP